MALRTHIRFAANTLADLERNITAASSHWGTVARVDMTDPDTGISFDAGTILSNGQRFFYATPRETWEKDGKRQSRDRVRNVTPAIAAKIAAQFDKMIEEKGQDYREVLGTPSSGTASTSSFLL